MAAFPRPVLRAAVLDSAAVVLFVAIGRNNHDEGGSPVAETLKVAAPFLIALAVGWLVARAWHHPDALRTGLVIWPVTVALGMVLRHWVFDRGTATSFIIVATIATAALLLGWRAVALLIGRRRGARATP
ncbi:MAG: DUF3054 domain-containing protein [Ilumatobacteraceae bacterium]